MKLNIADANTGQQLVVELDDEKRLRAFYDRRISHEVDGEHIGDNFKGYIFKITGGNDKQGFPMKQGVLTDQRVRLLLRKGMSCYRPRRQGERKRKSVRGAVVGPDLSVLNLKVVKRGDNTVTGLNDSQIPRRLGPKRASKIRKMFNLSKEDDVTKYVISRTVETKTGKTRHKKPNIQRLVTPLTLQRKRRRLAKKKQAIQKSKTEAAEYQRLFQQRLNERRESRRSAISKRRSSRRASQKVADSK